MKKTTKKHILIALLLLLAALAGGGMVFAKHRAAQEKKFLEGTLSSNDNGVTMEVEELFVTEDRFAVSVKGSRDDGELMGDVLWGEDYEWASYGMKDFTMDGAGYSPADGAQYMYFDYITPYEKAEDSPYLTFWVKNIGYQKPAHSEWVLEYPGKWRLCIPIEQTHPTIRKPMDKEIMLGGYRFRMKEIGWDVLGVTIQLERGNPAGKMNMYRDRIRNLEVISEDGSQYMLYLSNKSSSYFLNDPKPRDFKLKYTIQRPLNPEESDLPLPLLDVKNIKSILVDGVDLLAEE